MLLKNNDGAALFCPTPSRCFSDAAVTLQVAYKQLDVISHFILSFKLLSCEHILYVDTVIMPKHWSQGLVWRAVVYGSDPVPCVTQWREFVMYTEWVTAVTPADMTLLRSSHDLHTALVF